MVQYKQPKSSLSQIGSLLLRFSDILDLANTQHKTQGVVPQSGIDINTKTIPANDNYAGLMDNNYKNKNMFSFYRMRYGNANV